MGMDGIYMVSGWQSVQYGSELHRGASFPDSLKKIEALEDRAGAMAFP